jgi:hypothetical protein
MSCQNVELSVKQGATFTFVFRWETTPIVYRPITAILAQAPVRITATGHGLPAGWRTAVVSVRGMRQINAEDDPPRDDDYHQVTVIDANTVELNDINAASFSTYSGGGYLQFNTPVDLSGYTARMKVRDRVGGTELLLLTTENARIALDNALKTITLTLAANDTDDIAFDSAVYDLELVSGTGVVTRLAEGPFLVSKEVTTAT